MCISLLVFSVVDRPPRLHEWQDLIPTFSLLSFPSLTLYFLLDNNLIFERLLREEREEFTTIFIRILWMRNYQGRRNERRKIEMGRWRVCQRNFSVNGITHFWMCWFFDERVLMVVRSEMIVYDDYHTIFGTINSRLLSLLNLHLSVLSIFPTTSLLHHLHHHSFTTLSFLICFWLIIRKSFKKSLQTHSREKINNTGKLTSETSLTDSSSFSLYRLSLFQCSFFLLMLYKKREVS